MSCQNTDNRGMRVWSLRTSSSFIFVGTVLLPRNLFRLVGAGKIPAVSNAVAFGSIMQDGIVLPGNGAPCTIPAGSTPPGQFLASTADETWVAEGTSIVVAPKLPPYDVGSGTGCPFLMFPC